LICTLLLASSVHLGSAVPSVEKSSSVDAVNIDKKTDVSGSRFTRGATIDQIPLIKQNDIDEMLS
ncbi:hypothetical protein PENTCL1PPCAC_22136, partial [Pristionchus entomophagus]